MTIPVTSQVARAATQSARALTGGAVDTGSRNGHCALRTVVVTDSPGTGKTHTLIACGVAAVHAGPKARYLTAAELVEILFRGLADNSVGKVIDTLLRNDVVMVDEVGFAPLDDTGAQRLFRFVAAAYERRSIALASHWASGQGGRFLPEHTTAVSMLDRLLHHVSFVITDGESHRMRQAKHRTAAAPGRP